MNKLIFSLLFLLGFSAFSQNTTYWQQHVDYTMDIDMNLKNYQYKGKQKLVYTNNSPDTLNEIFYHLQFNAFQPGSEMDMRLQNIVDPDDRMANNIGTEKLPIYESRIATLKPDEIGFQKILSLKQDGKPVKHEIIGTILKVTLNSVIHSGKKSAFEMEFEAQIPIQIRRSGRNNAEDVALSMAQWYPKLAEYDFEGWHANQYIGREFYGVWGNFDVTIHIDKEYTIGSTGYLQNAQHVGHGYEDKSKKITPPKGKKLTWHFKAPNVHDFSWAADKSYIHDTRQVPGGPTLHFFYKNDPKITDNWKKMQDEAVKTILFYNNLIGDYPYKQYSIIQAGDGGMEYGMCTFITGNGPLASMQGTMRHEMAHAWFQFALATNETKHPWMDEGFTSYVSTLAANQNKKDNTFIFNNVYRTYDYLVKTGQEEPLTTQADRYNSNVSYGISSYYKGQIFLSQLGYIIGKENLSKTLKKYYADFKFKHPTPNNIKHTAELVSGIQLDWYLNEWTETTHNIDYAVAEIKDNTFTLSRIGTMPMPIDLTVTYTDGSTEAFYIPLNMMLGKKPTNATLLGYWAWGNPKFSFKATKSIKKVVIDSSLLMADIDRTNNILEAN